MLQVTCAIISDGERVLCTQRGPSMSLAGEWEFPGGKVEQGESLEECIVREIKEELGLEIRVWQQGPSSVLEFKPGQMLELIPFVAWKAGGHMYLREHAQARWCLPAELDGLLWAKADVPIVAWWKEHAVRFEAEILAAMNGQG